MSSILETLKAVDAAIRKQLPLPIIGGPRLAAFMEKNWGYHVIDMTRSGK
jgi:hypothetical protein